ncbi:MAG: hypothetical protein AB1611_09350 [bacterium]
MASAAVKKWITTAHFSLLLTVFLFSFFFLNGSPDSYAFYSLFGSGGSYPLGFSSLGGVGLGLGGWYGQQGGLLFGPLGFGGASPYALGILGSPYGGIGLNGLSGLGALGAFGFLGLGGIGIYGYGGFYDPVSLAYLLAFGPWAGLMSSQSSTISAAAPNPSAELPLNTAGKQQGKRVVRSFIAAEQAGSWEGTWFSLVKTSSTGKMTLDLVEAPVTRELSGSCTLLLNRYLTGPVDVSGTFDPVDSTFVLTGTYIDLLLKEWSLKLDCTLVDPENITGRYVLYDQLYSKGDAGNFDLSLIAPAISVSAPTQVVTVPTAVTAPVTIPVPITPIPGIAAPTAVAPTLTATVPLTTPALLPPAASPLFIPPIFTPLSFLFPPI